MPPLLPLTRRRAVAAALAGTLALAAPATAEPVKAGPATPDELAVLAVGGAVAVPGFSTTDGIALHRVATGDGSYRGRIAFPSSGEHPWTVISQSMNATLRTTAVKRSVDGNSLTLTAVGLPAGHSGATHSHWASLRVSPDGSFTALPWGAGFMRFSGAEPVASTTVDGSRYWAGLYDAGRALGTIAPGETAVTPLSGTGGVTPTNIEIADGTLYAIGTQGIFRAPGGGLPTAAGTAAPELVQPISNAFDAAFVDTDGAGGTDTLYVSRSERGLFKYTRSGAGWALKGFVAGNYGWIAARAVAGAVEIYSTNRPSTVVQKTVDTGEVGAEIDSTGPVTIARAPGGVRFNGLAFAPGTGFPADPAPYPPAPPTISASTTAVDTSVGATPRATVELDVHDANTAPADLTVTATSSNVASLPNDGIAITGSGNTRTVTFEPIANGTANVTFTVTAGDDTRTVVVAVRTTSAPPDPSGHYYSGLVDLSAALDIGGDYFLGVSDEVNTVRLYKKGVPGAPLASWNSGFPGGETDFEAVTRFGNTVVWSGSHGNNRSGSARPERRFLAFQTITGSGGAVDLDWSHSYTRLWQQWRDWDAANGHGLGANRLKFNTATVPGLLPNAPHGFNVEGLTMAPGSQSVAWFGMRAPTITGADGIERALILPVNNIDRLTSDSVDAEFGAPILLDLGGRSIRDIAKNARDQYLISAGTGDTDDSLKNWALYTWDGDPDHAPQMVKELPTDESRVGAWEGIAELPERLVPGSRVLMVADSGDTGLGKAYGQYVTLDEPHTGPAVVTGVTATARPGATEVRWEPAERATAYFISVKDAAGANAPGTPIITTGTSRTIEPLTAGTDYTVTVRAQNEATRSAAGTPVPVTPTEGARSATTTTLELVGTPVAGQPLKLRATLSAPDARGTIRFYDGNSSLRGPGNELDLPVVDGAVELDVTHLTGAGVRTFRAAYTTANPENYLSSQTTVERFIDYRPIHPAVELVSITGERVAGRPISFTYRLRGYTKDRIYPADDLPLSVDTRVDGAATLTRVVGNTPETQYGSVYFDPATGEATLTTTTLAAGKHRIVGHVGNFGPWATAFGADEIPLEIAPADSPAPEVRPIAHPKVFLTVSGARATNAPLTLTARVSDPALQGTVQFTASSDTFLGQPVPVVDGVATWTGTVNGTLPQLRARFEPAADRDTTASAVSPTVGLLRGPTEPPLSPATATVTTLRVAGDPLTAAVAVAPAVAAPFAENDLNGYVEVTSNGRVLDLARLLAGRAEVDLSALPAGAHSITARYVSADERRSTGSASAAVPVTITVEREAEAPVGGSVPATLALTMGAPAQFEPFVPGVAKDYTASTTATVVSTAGDAALSVSEPGHLANGAFRLAEPLRVELSPASWTGPVSHGNVDIAFKQAIGAGDALRTGTYSRTLTFTLSTTTP